MTKLTANQIEALALVNEREVSGVCVRYNWIFKAGSQVVTRAIKALEQKGYIAISYYRDSAAVNLTDLGRTAFE